MDVVNPTQRELNRLPEGTELVEFTPPGIPGLTDVVPAVGARLPTGQVMFFLKFTDPDEGVEFAKSGKLILLFPLGEVPIFSIGSLNPEPEKSNETN